MTEKNEIEYTEQEAEADRARGRVRYLASSMAQRLYWRWYDQQKHYGEDRSFEDFCDAFVDRLVEDFANSDYGRNTYGR